MISIILKVLFIYFETKQTTNPAFAFRSLFKVTYPVVTLVNGVEFEPMHPKILRVPKKVISQIFFVLQDVKTRNNKLLTTIA